MVLLLSKILPSVVASARETCLNDVTDLAISLPGSGIVVKCLRDLLLHGQSCNLSKAELEESLPVLQDIGLALSYELTQNDISKDIGNMENLEVLEF